MGSRQADQVQYVYNSLIDCTSLVLHHWTCFYDKLKAQEAGRNNQTERKSMEDYVKYIEELFLSIK